MEVEVILATIEDFGGNLTPIEFEDCAVEISSYGYDVKIGRMIYSDGRESIVVHIFKYMPLLEGFKNSLFMKTGKIIKGKTALDIHLKGTKEEREEIIMALQKCGYKVVV